jgi:hypothetical protein
MAFLFEITKEPPIQAALLVTSHFSKNKITLKQAKRKRINGLLLALLSVLVSRFLSTNLSEPKTT